jgi:AraC-like DNA-binding protein
MSADRAPYRISADLVGQLLQFGRKLGLPVDEALARHHIDLSPLPEQPAFMDGAEFERLLAVAMRMMQDPLPGLYATRLKVTTAFGLLGFLAQTASTVGTLLEVLIQSEALLGDTGSTRLLHEPGRARLHWDTRFTDPYVRAQAADFILSAYGFMMLSVSTPAQRVIDEVHLQHDAPADPVQLKRYHDAFGCPVYFRQPEYALVMSARALALPLPTANPQLHEVLEQHARRLLEEHNKVPSVTDLARMRLQQLLQQGDATRERLADVMGICGRTLHRKLKDAGTSYREILDTLRLDKARQLLGDSRQSVQAIAELAGFDESASFTRWFRERTGTTPSEFRDAAKERSAS